MWGKHNHKEAQQQSVTFDHTIRRKALKNTMTPEKTSGGRSIRRETAGWSKMVVWKNTIGGIDPEHLELRSMKIHGT